VDRHDHRAIRSDTMPTIEVSAATYERLASRAAAERRTVEDLVRPVLETLASISQPASRPPRELSNEEFSQALRAMAIDMPGVPPLPDDFSRADMYDDHD
jgi:hypothetical protein